MGLHGSSGGGGGGGSSTQKWFINSAVTDNINVNGTRYNTIPERAGVSTLESTYETMFLDDVTVQKLAVRCRSNSKTTDASVTLRKNGTGDTALTVTIPAGLTGQFDDTDSIDFDADDVYVLKLVATDTSNCLLSGIGMGGIYR